MTMILAGIQDYTVYTGDMLRYRDTNAWYHIVVAKDTDTINSKQTDIKIYVNGERITESLTE